MAAANTTISLKQFGGESENWRDFESQLRSIIQVANVDAANQVDYLKLHLKDNALQYFHTLDADTRGNLNRCLNALKTHFCNPTYKELYIIQLENMKYNHKTENPEAFLVKLQNLANSAYPDAEALPVEAARDQTDGERDRVAAETAANAERLRFSQLQREQHVKRLFLKAMPNFIRRKLLEQPEERTVGDLCTLARRTLYLNQICEVDDWNANAFSEVSNVQSEDYLNVLAKITETQSAMEDKMNNFIKKVDESLCLNAIQTNSRNYPRPQNYLPRYQQNRYRGNQFRSNYQRGRGYYQNRAYSSYQNQSYRPRYGQRFYAPQNNDASLAQGHYQAQNFHQSHGQTENPETLNATGGSQYMHYTKIMS